MTCGSTLSTWIWKPRPARGLKAISVRKIPRPGCFFALFRLSLASVKLAQRVVLRFTGVFLRALNNRNVGEVGTDTEVPSLSRRLVGIPVSTCVHCTLSLCFIFYSHYISCFVSYTPISNDETCETIKPVGRASHGSAYDTARQRVWIFGGYTTYYPYLRTDGSGSGEHPFFLFVPTYEYVTFIRHVDD